MKDVMILYLGPSWTWSYGSWIYNCLCNQCLSHLTLWVRIPLMWGVLYTTLCDNVCQLLATGRSFSPGTPVPSTNKTDRNDIAEIPHNHSRDKKNITKMHHSNKVGISLICGKHFHDYITSPRGVVGPIKVA